MRFMRFGNELLSAGTITTFRTMTQMSDRFADGRSLKALETLEVIPDPISLIESMRAVGYSVEAAIADLVDNSISARADLVEIKYDASDDPFVAILDNGWGMAPDELTNAMRHGSGNPTDAREPDDLGRFGLGLKTASLSQCRKLTVVSRKGDVTSARRWDLDVVQQSGRWLVVVPELKELETLPMFSRLQAQDSGTLVVWQDLDRLTAGAFDPQSEMTTKLSSLYEHLALVFHRFTQKEDGIGPVTMMVNGQIVIRRAAVMHLVDTLAFVSEVAERLEEDPVFGQFVPVEYSGTGSRNRQLRVHGFTELDDSDGTIGLVIGKWSDSDEPETLSTALVNQLSGWLENFVHEAVESGLNERIAEANPAYELACQLQDKGKRINRIRLHIFSNQPLTQRFKEEQFGKVAGIPIERHIWDLQRLKAMYQSTREREAVESRECQVFCV